jgi:H+/Cl- antiporter ClcA
MQAPMIAFVIILKMTGDHRAVIPIMAVSMIGYVTSRMLSREPLYHGLSRGFIAGVIRARRGSDHGLRQTSNNIAHTRHSK